MNNKTIFEEIEALVAFAFSDDTNRNRVVKLGRINENQADLIKAKTELEVEGYNRIIDVYGVKHTFRQHGNPQTEEKRGQIAITKEDFLLIPQIIESENIIWVGKNKLGKDCLLYEAIIEDVFYYVEEIRVGRKELALNTLYKRKPPKLDGSITTRKT